MNTLETTEHRTTINLESSATHIDTKRLLQLCNRCICSLWVGRDVSRMGQTGPQTIDVQAKRIGSWRVERWHWRHSIGLDSLFQKTPIFTPKNEQLSQEMHLKILHFSIGLKISGAVEKLLFTYLWNRYRQQIPGIKLIQIGAISILVCQH
jgi:hypothetical protein